MVLEMKNRSFQFANNREASRTLESDLKSCMNINISFDLVQGYFDNSLQYVKSMKNYLGKLWVKKS